MRPPPLLTSIVALFCLCLLAVLASAQAATIVYSNDFEEAVGPEWSTNRVTIAPAGNRTFLGEFTNETVRVAITDLPPGHTNLTVSLKLLALRRWTGGARLWRLHADGSLVYEGAFASVANSECQNYPQRYANGWYSPRTGAVETNTLGYSNACANCGDATYELQFTISHQTTTVVLQFSAEALYGESPPVWGIDDLQVAVGLPTVAITTPAFNTLYSAPTNILLAATASSASANIARVEFWANRQKIAEATSAPYQFLWTNVSGGTYFLLARAIDTLGFSNDAPTVLKVNGLFGEYFWGNAGQGNEFRGNRTTRFDPEPVWCCGAGNPISSSWSYYASVRWTGELEVPETGYYTFYAWRLDDGCRLWLDERRIIDAWGGHNHVTFPSLPVLLQAGSRHSLMMDYQQILSRIGEVQLFWQYGTNAAHRIPQRFFRPYLGGSNRSPNLPLITNPVARTIVDPVSVSFATDFFSDPDTTRVTPQRHQCTDYEVHELWVTGAGLPAEELAWSARCTGGTGLLQTNLTSGVFTNSHAGRQSLKPGTAYRVQIRYQDNSGSNNAWSQWAQRTFFTSPETGTVLLGPGSIWNYLDDGSDPGDAWKEPAFDDSSWSSGPAPLGYNTGTPDSWSDTHHATTLGFGLNANNKHLTTYFRKQFVLSNPGLVGWFTLQLLRDDGAVIYLNGTEIWRDNLPPVVPIGFGNKASSAVSGGAEDQYRLARFPTSLLRAGTNLFAVQVHQAETNSTDLHFDLQLYAAETPRPALSMRPATSGLVLSWPASAGYTLQWTTNLVPPIAWEEISNAGVLREGNHQLELPADAPQSFFRLARP